MVGFRFLAMGVSLAACVGMAGCSLFSSQDMATLQEQNRILSEKNQTLVSQHENLQAHARNVENQLKRTEEELALTAEKSGLDRQQLANLENERQQIYRQVQAINGNRPAVTSATSQRLAAISQKHPHLRFDPTTGIAKLDTDIVFETGSNELKPDAEKALQDLVSTLNAPESRDLHVLVVGHTDNRAVAGKEVREKNPNNFHLSANRALIVTDRLRRLGLADPRIGVAGFGDHQPLVPNVSAKDRQKNRRVEIFVMSAEVPVVGWTETIPSLY
jgi:chemotaxis protein MotB